MSPLRGIALKLGAVVLFITMATLIKLASAEVPTGQAVFFRSAFAIPVILVWLALRGDLRTGLKTTKPMLHFWRGLIGTTAMALGFGALALLPLPEAKAIGFAAPLLTVIFAAMFLGEKVRAFRLTVVGLGLLGVSIVTWPKLTLTGSDDVALTAALGAMMALTGAVFVALAQIHIRRMVATEQVSAIVFWFSATAAGLALLTAPFGWVMPSPSIVLMLVMAGVLGGLAQIMLTSAYRYADASLIAPFDYVSIIFAILFGWTIFGDVPSRSTLIGAAVVVFAGLLIIWREHQLGLKRGRARPSLTPQG